MLQGPAPRPLIAPVWIQVGMERHSLPVGITRLYENALDWRRLPHVHDHSVRAVACLDERADGWQARVITLDGAEWVVDLTLERRAQRLFLGVRGDHGPGRRQEALLRVDAAPGSTEQVDVRVTLFVADLPNLDRRAAGRRLSRTFARFWTADVAMMVERQRQIDRRVDGAGPDRQRDLGPREGLPLPMVFELGGRAFVVAEAEGRLVVFPRRCPHQFGPLEGGLAGRVLTCPWHGYRFDVVTGENLSGGVCRLSDLPDLQCTADGRVVVSATH